MEPTPEHRGVCGHRMFKIKAMEVSGAAQKLTEGLSGKRDLAKLSPWLAEYSAASGNGLTAHQACGLPTKRSTATRSTWHSHRLKHSALPMEAPQYEHSDLVQR